MRLHLNTLLLFSVLVAACVQAPVFETSEQALLKSNYPIVSLNGADIDPSYQLELEPGETTAVIVYNTYRYDYVCTFTWTAAEATVYEVTDHENAYPLTLYRWKKVNGLWSARRDPIDPTDCLRQ